MSENFTKKKLFNPEGNDSRESRSIIKGNTTNLFNLNDVKYEWGNRMYRMMTQNVWFPEKVSLVDDKIEYEQLTMAERRAYDGILSFLVFLDSIQTNNIANISDYITAPEVNLPLAIQIFQEAIHSQSYQVVIESVIPKASRAGIYDRWRNDKVLFERNKYIASIYQDFIDNDSDENFSKVLIANYLLEGIYFYNGFNFFYNLANRNLMQGTSEMIRYINRDEMTHCVLFEYMIKDINRDHPDFFDWEMIEEMFRKATEQEIEWTNHIIGDDILGINAEITDIYTKYLANSRWKKLGREGVLYEGEKYTNNPYKHLEKIADTKSGEVKSNFFESTVTSYSDSSAVKGWDDF